jgi:hypothetical protein
MENDNDKETRAAAENWWLHQAQELIDSVERVKKGVTWSGPFENENWEAEHERACAWFDGTISDTDENVALPYRVHKQRWLLDAPGERMRVDLVYWRETGVSNYRVVFDDDDDTLDNFATLDEAKAAAELVDTLFNVEQEVAS